MDHHGGRAGPLRRKFRVHPVRSRGRDRGSRRHGRPPRPGLGEFNGHFVGPNAPPGGLGRQRSGLVLGRGLPGRQVRRPAPLPYGEARALGPSAPAGVVHPSSVSRSTARGTAGMRGSSAGSALGARDAGGLAAGAASGSASGPVPRPSGASGANKCGSASPVKPPGAGAGGSKRDGVGGRSTGTVPAARAASDAKYPVLKMPAPGTTAGERG
jgi:hypothetical protein